MKLKLTIILLIHMVMFAANAKEDIKYPDSYNFLRGLEAMQASDYPQAHAYFSEEVEANPKNGYAYGWLATIEQYNEDYGQALRNCDLALKHLPAKDKAFIAYAHKLKAEIYKELGEYDKAISEYDAAVKANPEDVDLLHDHGQFHYSLGTYDLAEADYRKIIRLEPARPLGYLGLGRNMIALEHFEEAIKQFDYAIKLDSTYGRAYAFRAEAHLALANWNKGTDDLISALAADSDDKAFSLMQDLTGEALETFLSKLKIQGIKEPNEAKWPYYAGVVHDHSNQPTKAIPQYKTAMEKDANAVFAERIASCYQDLGDFTQALAWTNRALELNGGDFVLALMKADLLYDSGDIDGAISELDKFIGAYPEFYYGYYRRGFFKDNARRFDDAQEDYSLAIALNPDYAYAYLGRGDMLKAKGEMARAMADYRKVVELDTVPSSSSAAPYALLELGRKEEAIAFLDAMIAADPDNAGNYYDAACLYSRMQLKDKALGSLMTAFEKGYRRFAHAMADNDLEYIRDTETFRNLMEEYRNRQSEGNQAKESEGYVEEVVTVPFSKEGGVCKVKCSINGLPLHFIFDTGASSVSISMVEANFMMKNDYIKPSDIIGSQHFMDANGDISEGTIINLNHVDFGGLELTNVKASVVRNQKAPLLLGQTVLNRLGKIEIDNDTQQLKITHKTKR